MKLLPTPAQRVQEGYTFAQGYELLPVWELVFRRGDDHPTWRARVDAMTGEVLELIDTNRYAQVTGGYWPISWRVGGATVNQVSTGWPFTSVNPLGATSNTSGLYSWDGNPQTAYHTGPFVNVVDSCTGAAGTANSDASGNIDFGTFNPPDPTLQATVPSNWASATTPRRPASSTGTSTRSKRRPAPTSRPTPGCNSS